LTLPAKNRKNICKTYRSRWILNWKTRHVIVMWDLKGVALDSSPECINSIPELEIMILDFGRFQIPNWGHSAVGKSQMDTWPRPQNEKYYFRSRKRTFCRISGSSRAAKEFKLSLSKN
jgi:hypothetical protein